MKQSRIIQGLMRIDSISDGQVYDLLCFDLERGISFFDLADIYGGGEAERKVGRVLKAHPELREKMFIQSKVSIYRAEGGNYYDLSRDHILTGVNEILERLGISYLDSLLLHRPDILMEADEVAEAFDILQKQGKVRHFGVSNFSAGAMRYLANRLRQPIEYNQVQLGLGHMPMVSEALNFNMDNHEGTSRSEDTFFYMKKHSIQIQAWSPFLVGFFQGSLFDDGRYPDINRALWEMANKYQVSRCAIATAFLLKLDKDLHVVTGSLNPDHIQECLDGEKIDLSKEDWYFLYRASGNMLP